MNCKQTLSAQHCRFVFSSCSINHGPLEYQGLTKSNKSQCKMGNKKYMKRKWSQIQSCLPLINCRILEGTIPKLKIWLIAVSSDGAGKYCYTYPFWPRGSMKHLQNILHHTWSQPTSHEQSERANALLFDEAVCSNQGPLCVFVKVIVIL